MESRTVFFGGKDRPVLDLADSWAGHVLRFIREGSSTDVEACWGAHDYVPALIIRDALQRGLPDPTSPPAFIDITDQMFRSFTQPDEHADLRLVDHDHPHDEWWCRRIPKAGPIAAELQQLYQRPHARRGR
ncbi:MAG TPA: hypothetical protein VMF57_16990 [Solirubrobacteraceae bacterium]|nr:hypothetical protein [Solirubrobacteraceae bacterium]